MRRSLQPRDKHLNASQFFKKGAPRALSSLGFTRSNQQPYLRTPSDVPLQATSICGGRWRSQLSPAKILPFASLVAMEMPVYNTTQKLVAEFLGTFALVFFGAGAICAERFLQGAGGGVLGGALASGLAIAILSVAFSHVSGAHFNPAVTIGFWITKRLSTLEVLGYWLAQIFGGSFAAFILKAFLPRDEAWQPALGGTPDLVRDFTRLPAMGLEALITFFLVLVYFATLSEDNVESRPLSGLAVGFVYTIGILVAGPFTGAAFNPARAFGPALASTHWANQGVYWVGPLAGGFLAGLIYDALYGKKQL
jgi:MIP family channel proteins